MASKLGCMLPEDGFECAIKSLHSPIALRVIGGGVQFRSAQYPAEIDQQT